MIRGLLFLSGLVAALLAGCADGSRYTFQAPDAPPSKFSGDIVYPPMRSQAQPAPTETPFEPVKTPPQPAADVPAVSPRPKAPTLPPPDVYPPPSYPSPGLEAPPVVSISTARVLDGRVTVANLDSGVCVVNFPIGQLPPVDKVMTVYRHGARIGQIKVTGPARDDNIAAEIIRGEIQPDDEARDR